MKSERGIAAVWQSGVVIQCKAVNGSLKVWPFISLLIIQILSNPDRVEIGVQFGEEGVKAVQLFCQLLSLLESVFESFNLGSEWTRFDTKIPYRSRTTKVEVLP